MPALPDLKELENDHVKVFSCVTTFERALVFEGNLKMFAKAARDIGAPKIVTKLREGYNTLQAVDEGDKKAILDPLRDAVLNTAKRFGKARFAQLAAVHAEHATTLPKYLADAVKWLQAE